MGCCGLDACGSEQGSVVGVRVHGSELWGCIKCEEFLDQLGDH
jgi:hypothetical protein